MIREEDSNILQDFGPGNHVIINPVNCRAMISPGLQQQISKKYAGWFDDFHEYCSWFQKSNWSERSHYDEILGTFHRFQPKDNLIICSVFVHENQPKSRTPGDLDLWAKVLTKIERQTQRVGRAGQIWTLHISGAVCDLENELGETLREVVDEVFSESSVKIVIHNTDK